MDSLNGYFRYKTAAWLVIIGFGLTYSYYFFSWIPFFDDSPDLFFKTTYLVQSIIMLYIWLTFRRGLREKFSIRNLDGFFYLIYAVIILGQLSYLFDLSNYLPYTLSKLTSIGYSSVFLVFALKLLSVSENLYQLKHKLSYSLIAIYIISLPYTLFTGIFSNYLLLASVQFGGFIAALLNTIYLYRFFKRAENDDKPVIDPMEEMIEEIGG